MPAVPVVAPSSTTSDLSSEIMQVEVAQVVEVEVEDVAIDDLVPSSTPNPSAVVEEEADVAVAPTPVPVTTTVPATATVRFGSAVQEVAPSGFPVASGSNRGVSGLFPPSSNKSPFGSSFVTLAAGAGAGVGAGASTMPIATNNLSFLGTPSSTSAPASGGVQGFGGVASSLSAPFTFGSAAKKGSTFGSQLSMGFATGAPTSNISNIAEALPPSASESDAMVLQMHSEDSMGHISRDMAEGEGGEIEDDFEGTQSYFEDEHSHSQSSTFTQPMGSSFTPAPLSVPVSSSFGFSNPSSDAQKPSIFGLKRTLGETGFGSSVPSSSAGSSFVAAAPFFLLSQSSASPRIGGISGAVTGSANPFAIAPSLGFLAPTPDAALSPASALVPVPVPALSIASTPFSSPVPVELSTPADVQVVSRGEAVSSIDSFSAAASTGLPTPTPTPTPTPAFTPVATTPVVPVPAPAPARQAAGRKLKPKPAHLVAAIPAFAQVINSPNPNRI